MAKHTNASKKFFKKPNTFRSNSKPNYKVGFFVNSHVENTSATGDFFLKPGAENETTSERNSNSAFQQNRSNYRVKENQIFSQRNTDKDTLKTFGISSKNLLPHNRSQPNQHRKSQESKEANFSNKSVHSSQRTDESISRSFVGNREKSNFRNYAKQFERNENDQVSKKPFDKKKYRLQKYSKKYKLQQWEDKRKKAIMHEYYKTVSKDEQKGLDVEKIYQESEMQEADEENDNNVNAGLTGGDKPSKSGGTNADTVKQIAQDSKSKKKPFKRVQEEFKRLKEDKIAKREEILKKKAEKDEARKKFKKEKIERYRKLSRRTKKGQPIMKDRIEMLLEKIQTNIQA